jgi:hypothetical protein
MTDTVANPQCAQMDSPGPAAVLRRLPGKARPREDVLQEYQDLNARRRKDIPSILWRFWVPDPEDLFRWRVQLDCDCVIENMAHSDEDLPTAHGGLDYAHQAWLPAGQRICVHDNPPTPPYQRIVEWGERREMEFPADSLAPPKWADEQTWAVIRRDEPHTSAFWRVTLTCRHVTEVTTDLEWKPTDGPNRITAERQQEMIAEFEGFWASQPPSDGEDDGERAHTRRMLEDGWPIPRPEQRCYTCRYARLIVAYERVGWLVPRKPAAKPPRPPSRKALERRLRQTETEADRLREALAQLDHDTSRADLTKNSGSRSPAARPTTWPAGLHGPDSPAR